MKKYFALVLVLIIVMIMLAVSTSIAINNETSSTQKVFEINNNGLTFFITIKEGEFFIELSFLNKDNIHTNFSCHGTNAQLDYLSIAQKTVVGKFYHAIMYKGDRLTQFSKQINNLKVENLDSHPANEVGILLPTDNRAAQLRLQPITDEYDRILLKQFYEVAEEIRANYYDDHKLLDAYNKLLKISNLSMEKPNWNLYVPPTIATDEDVKRRLQDKDN